MSLARIEIQQHEFAKWVAEVEVGGLVARREVVRGSSFEEIMIAIEDQYRKLLLLIPIVSKPKPPAMPLEPAETALPPTVIGPSAPAKIPPRPGASRS